MPKHQVYREKETIRGDCIKGKGEQKKRKNRIEEKERKKKGKEKARQGRKKRKLQGFVLVVFGSTGV
jgi:hypothetical protein